MRTIRRDLGDKKLTDLRAPGHAKNSPIILDKAEVDRRYTRRKKPLAR